MMGPCRGTYAVYQFPFGESKLLAFNDQFGWWDWYNTVIKVTFSNSLLRKRTLPPAFPWNSAVLRSLHNCDSFEDLPMGSGIQPPSWLVMEGKQESPGVRWLHPSWGLIWTPESPQTRDLHPQTHKASLTSEVPSTPASASMARNIQDASSAALPRAGGTGLGKGRTDHDFCQKVSTTKKIFHKFPVDTRLLAHLTSFELLHHPVRYPHNGVDSHVYTDTPQNL